MVMFLPSGHHCTCLFKELFPPILLHRNNDIPVLEFLPRKFPGLNGIIKYAEFAEVIWALLVSNLSVFSSLKSKPVSAEWGYKCYHKPSLLSSYENKIYPLLNQREDK